MPFLPYLCAEILKKIDNNVNNPFQGFGATDEPSGGEG